MKPIVLLLSGGLDSYLTGALLRERGYPLLALSVDYGQRAAAAEGAAAEQIACRLEAAAHFRAELPLAPSGSGTPPTDPALPLPRDRTADQRAGGRSPCYVPGRNLVLLSLALSVAEAERAGGIAIGCNRTDHERRQSGRYGRVVAESPDRFLGNRVPGRGAAGADHGAP